MALEREDLDSISNMIDGMRQQVTADVSAQINQAKFGGPTVQVAPTDLVFLGNGNYVSDSKGRTYQKQQGRLIDMGPIPDPL